MATIGGIHHVSVNVADVDAALGFYTAHLGFAVRPDRPDFPFAGAWLQTGEHQLHLIEDPTPAPSGAHFAILVTDLDEIVSRLRADGIDVTDPSPVGSARQSFLRDPSDNLIELHERQD